MKILIKLELFTLYWAAYKWLLEDLDTINRIWNMERDWYTRRALFIWKWKPCYGFARDTTNFEATFFSHRTQLAITARILRHLAMMRLPPFLFYGFKAAFDSSIRDRKFTAIFELGISEVRSWSRWCFRQGVPLYYILFNFIICFADCFAKGFEYIVMPRH